MKQQNWKWSMHKERRNDNRRSKRLLDEWPIVNQHNRHETTDMEVGDVQRMKKR